VGVGGLAHAAATHYKATSLPRNADGQTRIMTVEPGGAACFHESLKAGRRVTISPKETILKNLSYETVSEAAWEVLQHCVDISALVGDQDVKRAMAEMKAEGIDLGLCGGAIVAALRSLMIEDVKEKIGLDTTSIVVLIITDGQGE